MKKNILIITLAFLTLSAVPAYAHDPAQAALEVGVSATTSIKMDRTLPAKPLVKPILKLQEDVRVKLEARKASSTKPEDLRERNSSSTMEKLGNVVRKIVRNRFENMLARFEATIERQESIMKRIISRIEKVKTAGGDVAVAEKFIGEAKVHIEESKVTLASLKLAAGTTAELEASTTVRVASSTRAALVNLRKISQDLEHHLRATHKALVNAVSNLLGMSSARPKLEATTTLEVNTQI